MAREFNAGRYARAIFEIGQERNALDKWQSDLRAIARLTDDVDIINFFESPKIPFQSKAKLLSEQLKEVNPLALNLIYLLITRGKLERANDIAEGYQKLLDAYNGVEYTEVTTAVPLNKDETEKLSERIGKLVGKKVVVKLSVDPDIIGGVIARVGDKLIDGSTRNKLRALRNELAGLGR